METMRRGGGASSSSGGKIIPVQGGHIIRPTGRKDRHSKVYTAKGPRDRRVRLAAHTAIQFYDVQDRLGYDRPSKAVDWLMSKAKDAIERLHRLPRFDPACSDSHNIRNLHLNNSFDPGLLQQMAANLHGQNSAAALPPDMVVGGGEGRNEGNQSESSTGGYHHGHNHIIHGGGEDGNAALSLNSQSMRSFFPATTSSMRVDDDQQQQEQMNSFGGYHHPHLSYPKHHQQVQYHQDLGLSLHTFHDQESDPTTTTHTAFQQAAGFQEPAGPHGHGGDNTWADGNNSINQIGRFSRLLAWTGGGFGSPGVVIGSANLPEILQSRFDDHQQQQQQQQPPSSSSSIRAWEDLQLPLGFPQNNRMGIGDSSSTSPKTSYHDIEGSLPLPGFSIPAGSTRFQQHLIVPHNHHNLHGSDNKDSSFSTDSNHH